MIFNYTNGQKFQVCANGNVNCVYYDCIIGRDIYQQYDRDYSRLPEAVYGTVKAVRFPIEEPHYTEWDYGMERRL